MPNKKLTISVPQEHIDDLAMAFSRSSDGKLTDTELETLVSIAIETWAETLVETSRFRTMTELYVA